LSANGISENQIQRQFSAPQHTNHKLTEKSMTSKATLKSLSVGVSTMLLLTGIATLLSGKAGDDLAYKFGFSVGLLLIAVEAAFILTAIWLLFSKTGRASPLPKKINLFVCLTVVCWFVWQTISSTVPPTVQRLVQGQTQSPITPAQPAPLEGSYKIPIDLVKARAMGYSDQAILNTFDKMYPERMLLARKTYPGLFGTELLEQVAVQTSVNAPAGADQ
jgi:hypothetical protein